MIATGGRPRMIPGITADGERILTSHEAMVLPERPERILIVGAGAIGVEFAYFYASFGTKVTLVEMFAPAAAYRGRGDRQGTGPRFLEEGDRLAGEHQGRLAQA